MLLTKGSREDAIHALINTWLKDTTLRCGWCGNKFNKAFFPCCDQPFIGTNLDIMHQFYRELQKDRQTRQNIYASSKDKTMRWKLTFPPGLLRFLTITFKAMYGEDLFNNKYDTTWFAKKFKKYFTVPERI